MNDTDWLDENLRIAGVGENAFIFVPAGFIPVTMSMENGEPSFEVQKGAELEALEQLKQWFHHHGMLVEEDYRVNCTKSDPNFVEILKHLEGE